MVERCLQRRLRKWKLIAQQCRLTRLGPASTLRHRSLLSYRAQRQLADSTSMTVTTSCAAAYRWPPSGEEQLHLPKSTNRCSPGGTGAALALSCLPHALRLWRSCWPVQRPSSCLSSCFWSLRFRPEEAPVSESWQCFSRWYGRSAQCLAQQQRGWAGASSEAGQLGDQNLQLSESSAGASFWF